MAEREQVSVSRRAAFTLVELLVVVAIIALLLALMTPSFRRAKSLAIRTQCAANEKQWGNALAAYAPANHGAFPYNGRATTGVPWGGRDVSWNSTTVQQFWARYLVADSKASKTEQHDVLNCPTQKWHMSYGSTLTQGLVGYFYLPHRDPTFINYAPPSNPEGKGWVEKKAFGGPYWNTPIMMDMKQFSTSMGSWFYNPSIPFSSHFRPDGLPEGGNYLFEDGHVAWYVNEVIELGATMGGWDFWYKIPL